MGKNHYVGVTYATIDGKRCKPENIYGYCKAHQGVLTYPLVQLHRCKCRKDGQPCMHLIKFDRNDNRYESALKGDEFRESLGRKGKRKGERKKRTASDSMPEVAELPDSSQEDYSTGCMEQVGNIQTVGTDLRLEGTGSRNNHDKDRCAECFWRKMFCRLVYAYICTGRDER